MVIKIPEHHSFPQSLTDKISDKIGCPIPEWEISVDRRHDLAWSIVLSYLISTNYNKKSDDFDKNDGFKIRLKALTGSDANSNLVHKAIRGFNPFRNRYSCFYDEVLKTVVKDFRKLMSWDSLLGVSDKLSAASKALNCSILLVRDNENHELYKKNVTRRGILITLFAYTFKENENENNPLTVYNFMIHHDLALRMKKAAFVYFLKETRVSKKELNYLKSVCTKDNFLIAVLNSKYKDTILKLYESPYIVSKLTDAGFEMDPRAKDAGGLSVLHHALLLENPNIWYRLYYFAANNCCQSEGSYRNPDYNIVSNLVYMGELLSNDLSKLNIINDTQTCNEVRLKYDDLLTFNRFLIEVNSKILKIKSELNYYESIDEHVFEANKRRDIILALLDTYELFFKGAYRSSTVLSPLDDYIFFKNYYNLLDMATAIIFFDNIIFLKERLKLNEKQFSEIESSFYFSVLYHIVLEQEYILKFKKHTTRNLQFHKKCYYIFPLLKRLDNSKKMKNFSQILHDTVINKGNVVKNLPEKEVNSIFHSCPIFKDGLEITRLYRYIQTSLKTKITDVKSVLVIEKVLQVIGECIAPEEKDDFSFKRFLSLCLPKEISLILRRLRHELTHLKGHAFPSKFDCENNLSLFRSIQKEIYQIKIHFKWVYQVMVLSFKVYIMRQLEKELERIKNEVHLYTSTSVQPFFVDESSFIFIRNLKQKLFEGLKSSCHTFFKIALQNIEDETNKLSVSSNTVNNNDLKNRIIYLLWPLKWLIELLQQCGMSNIITLLETFEAIETCDSQIIKEKKDIFLRKCNDFLPAFNIVGGRKRLKTLKSIENIEHFMKILKGFVYLSIEEKEKIREEIPQIIKQSVLRKEKLIQSIEEGFSLDIEAEEFEISYLSKTKVKALREHYECKDKYALTILETIDPISELEEIFSKNSADKKKYDALCDTMEFSDKTRKKLGKLVAGQRKKIPINNLCNLLNRIQLLKKILIEENREICNLWVKVKSQKSRLLLEDKIIHCYLKDTKLQAAAEMLLFDCMMLFETVKVSENPWIKSSKLYSGIDLRNVISHGSPLLESLCTLLDPGDLASEIIKKMLLLIKGEDAIIAILELYDAVGCDYVKFQEVINIEKKDEYSELRDRIMKCNEWKNYALLLPYKPTKNTNKL